MIQITWSFRDNEVRYEILQNPMNTLRVFRYPYNFSTRLSIVVEFCKEISDSCEVGKRNYLKYNICITWSSGSLTFNFRTIVYHWQNVIISESIGSNSSLSSEQWHNIIGIVIMRWRHSIAVMCVNEFWICYCNIWILVLDSNLHLSMKWMWWDQENKVPPPTLC